ncbi:hypothetical protein [Micromonospora noduli]|uniref:hypothetical protein n=1 Tax=Micromonospora noduli TaxID=709876 RepID=UPI0011BEBEAE|nr:hypothetical protein [Micromonospora noduli]
MSYPQIGSTPRNEIAGQRAMRDWTRDVAVNVVANLLAAAIIWLLVSATGYVKGNAALTAVAAVVVVSVLSVAITDFAVGAHRRVDAGSMSRFRFNLIRSSPAIFFYLLLIVAVPLTLLDIPSDLNSAWRAVPWWLRSGLMIFLAGIGYLAGFLRAWIQDRKGELEDESEELMAPLPLLLRIFPASFIVIAAMFILTVMEFGLHWPWNY